MQVVQGLLRRNATALVDVLLWECHNDAATRRRKDFVPCDRLIEQMTQHGVSVHTEMGDSTAYGLGRVVNQRVRCMNRP